MPVIEEDIAARNSLLVGLLHGCAQGRQQDFERLYQLVSPQLFSLLTRILKRRDLAEEALQDAFVSVWRNAGTYTAERGSPMSWLLSIGRYRALDMLRHNRFEVRFDPSDHSDPYADLPALVDSSMEAELSYAEDRALKRCLDGLQETQRSSLRLAYFQGYSHEDIASNLGAPIGTVKSWVRRGLQALKRCLEAA